jgi:Electron transfer DM13
MPHRVARRTIAIVGLPVVLWWLQAWKSLIRTTADERLSSGAQTTCCGEFTGHIQRTSGVARLITLGHGAQIRRLKNLHTTLGPRLRVWLRDTPVDHPGLPWRKFAHSSHIDLRRLRSNRGNVDYAVPNDADTDALSSVILCASASVCPSVRHNCTPDPMSPSALESVAAPFESRILRRERMIHRTAGRR